jgi:predicted Zn-dependent protease
MIGRERALEISHRALSSVSADQVEVMLLTEEAALTRFYNSRIHQNVEREDLLVSVRLIANGGLGQAYTSSDSPDGLRDVGKRALEIALSRPKTARFGFSCGGEVSQVQTFFEGTAVFGPDSRACLVGQMAAVADLDGYLIHGAVQTDRYEIAVITSSGASQYVPLTMGAIRVVAASDQGATGFAEGISRDIYQLDPEALARRSVKKCRLNHGRASLPPGSYVTILEEIAVADLVRFLGTLGLNGQAVQEGRSFAGDRVGQQVIDSRLTLSDDPWDPRGLVMPFDYEGTPKRPVTLIEHGVLRQVVHDLQTAALAGTQSTGHAAPPDPEAMTGYPAPTNLFLDGGDSSVEDMIANTEVGVLVTCLHYTNSPDPRRVVVTGTTRDGTYLIKNGKIAGALFDQRFRQSVLEALNSVIAIGKEPQLHRDWWCGGGISMQHGVINPTAHHVPALQVARFDFVGESPRL